MDHLDEPIEAFDALLDQIQSLLWKKVHMWQEHVVWGPLWWMGVFLTVAPWLLWAVYHNKRSTDLLLYVGCFIALVSLCLDILGDQLGLWHYRFNVIPVLPTYFPWDLTLMPVSVLVFLEYKPKASPFIKALAFALMASYLAEPFFTWLKVYNPVHWRFSYSIPIQFLLYLAAHALSRRSRFAGIE